MDLFLYLQVGTYQLILNGNLILIRSFSVGDWSSFAQMMCSEAMAWDTICNKCEVLVGFDIAFICMGGCHGTHWATTAPPFLTWAWLHLNAPCFFSLNFRFSKFAFILEKMLNLTTMANRRGAPRHMSLIQRSDTTRSWGLFQIVLRLFITGHFVTGHLITKSKRRTFQSLEDPLWLMTEAKLVAITINKC